jgi:hypothetical protein
VAYDARCAAARKAAPDCTHHRHFYAAASVVAGFPSHSSSDAVFRLLFCGHPTMRLRLWTLASMITALAVTTSMADAQTQPSTIAEDRLAGNRQPEWTARPLFAESDVYVLPKGASAFEFSLRPTTAADGTTTTDSAYRAEFGLPARVQLGVHAAGRARGRHDTVGNIDAQAIELRWAVARWGVAWGNPTVHVEWREASRGADVGTMKLLLGGGATRWRWSSNVAWAQEASGVKAIDRSWTAGISRAAGRVLSVGAETRLAFVDRLAADGRSRTPMTRELLGGPSLQLRPVGQMYIDLAALFGANAASPRSRMSLLAGWQF